MQFDDKEIGKKPGAKQPLAAKKKQRSAPAIHAQIVSGTPPLRELSVPQITMKDWLRLIDTLFLGGLVLLTCALPLFFLPVTADSSELNKQVLLVFGTLALAILQSIRAFVAGAIAIKLSSLFAGLFVLCAAWLVASIASHYPYASFFGLQGQEYMSFATVAALALYAILLAHSSKRIVLLALSSLVASVAVGSLVSILYLYGLSPAMPLGAVETWGPVAVLGLLVSVGLLALLSWSQHQKKSAYSSLLALSLGIQLVTLLILDDWRLWLSVIAGLVVGIAVLFWKLKDERPHLWVMVPSALLVVSILGLVVHLRIVQLPLSIQPTWVTSANLSFETIKSSPFFGFGPGTFIESYTRFRPASINTVNYLNLWNSRFDSASAGLFTAIAGLGLVGFLALFALAILLVKKIVSFIKSLSLGDELLLMLAVSMPLAAVFVLSLVKPGNMALVFIDATLFGGVLALIPKTSVRFTSEQQNRFLMASSTLITIAGAAFLVALVSFSARYGGELAFAKALSLDRALSGRIHTGETVSPDDVDAVTTSIVEAIKRDPSVDLYYRTLSQALLTKTTMFVQNGTQDIAALQLLTEQVITAAKKAADLNANDVRNAENLAAVYQQLASFTGGAEQFAVDAFGKARLLDPNNPQIYLNMAKMYLQLADGHRKRANAEKDPKNSPETALAVKNARDAERAANEALKLKSNLPAAHYYLAVVKSQIGENTEALDLLAKATQENAALIAQQAADRELFAQLATSFAALGDRQKALDTVKIALSLMPDDQQSLWLYGNLLADTGEKEEGIAVLGKLLEKNPKNEGVIKRLQELKGISTPASSEQPPTADIKDEDRPTDETGGDEKKE